MDQIGAYFTDKVTKTGVVSTPEQLKKYAVQKQIPVSIAQIRRFYKRHPLVAKYSIAKPPKHFASVGVLRPGVWFIDFAEYRKNWSGFNKGYIGFLVAVENVTHKLHVFPVKDKSTESWNKAIGEFVELRRDIETIISDRDSVATSKSFIDTLKKKYGIKWFYLYKNSKSWLAEVHIYSVKKKLSQATWASKTKCWIKYLPTILKEHNTETIKGTSYKRQAIQKENFAHFLQQLLKSDEPELRFSSSRIGEFKHAMWNKRIFKFALGQKVLLAKKANWKKPISAFHKASVKGTFDSTPVTISGRQLRKTKDYKRVVAGKNKSICVR
jgi:hypothetical protein